MNPVFELNNLHVSLQSHHKEIELVRGVSFAVAPGECLGILGESGSGKSMSMKAAMGLLDHSFHVKGSAQFQGEELLGKSAEELRRLRGGKVGIILQNPMTCFDPLYRIGQQIAETFSAHNNWTAEEIHIRSLELLEKMRIRNPEEVLEKYPHQLSGGMLQRIMIGIATAMKPSLLIADEPTTAIDAITQYEILNELLHIKENHNTAMIFISHDLNERKKSWDFSTPYYTDYVNVLVEDSSGIKALADMKDKVVGVSSGSTSARALVQEMIDEGILTGEGFDAETFNADTWKDGISFRQYDDYPAISTALSAGEVDGFCVDKSILAIYKTEGRSYIDAEFSPQEYGVATKKDSGFSAVCDDLITGWLADGTIDGLIKDNGLA